jgi:uncharacterized small protein (DUF1192 family)
MWEEEDKPVPRRVPPIPLETFGVAELRDYIAELSAEIARVEAAIAAKQDHKAVANSFFKT